MVFTISKEIIQLDPEGIDFNDKVSVKALILKLLNVIEAQTPEKKKETANGDKKKKWHKSAKKQRIKIDRTEYRECRAKCIISSW
jgi:hypothetical protein